LKFTRHPPVIQVDNFPIDLFGRDWTLIDRHYRHIAQIEELNALVVAELEQAIRAVARGETFLSSKVSHHLVSGFVHGKGRSAPDGSDLANGNDAMDKLTLRQRETLQLIAEGSTTKEIAKKLNISVKTVETHRMQLMERLDIHDIAGLVRYALRSGLIEQGT